MLLVGEQSYIWQPQQQKKQESVSPSTTASTTYMTRNATVSSSAVAQPPRTERPDDTRFHRSPAASLDGAPLSFHRRPSAYSRGTRRRSHPCHSAARGFLFSLPSTSAAPACGAVPCPASSTGAYILRRQPLRCRTANAGAPAPARGETAGGVSISAAMAVAVGGSGRKAKVLFCWRGSWDRGGDVRCGAVRRRGWQ
jgi:hypothetical protein